MIVYLLMLRDCVFPACVLSHHVKELAQWHSSTNPKIPDSIPARSHTGVVDYDEACFMHVTPGVVHNFPKAVGV